MKNKKLIELSFYLDCIKEVAQIDVAHIQNNVLNKSPYTSELIGNYLFDKKPKKISKLFLFKKIIIFYTKNIFNFFLFLIHFLLFKLFGKKSNVDYSQDIYLVDIFFMVDTIIEDGIFKDKYFSGLYKLLKKYSKSYAFLPRLYGVGKNPIKFLRLLNILNHDKENTYLLQYEFLTFPDIIKILSFILNYPLKQFELIQPKNSYLDKLFNYELFNSLENTSFEPFVRYLIGQKIANRLTDNSKIFSWQEFQTLERTFNKAIRESNNKITIYGCEFLIKSEIYIGMHITDTDVDLMTTPHVTLLNGIYNYSQSKKHNFKKGVSLRYKNIFSFKPERNSDGEFLASLGNNANESLDLLKALVHIDKLKIKLHPASDEKYFNNYLQTGWSYENSDLYELFKKLNIIFVSPMSGVPLEAIACGVSVIIIANPNRLIGNPMVNFGYKKIWDVGFEKNDVKDKVRALLKYRRENPQEIDLISKWYSENFFIEPTEKNIIKAFELR